MKSLPLEEVVGEIIDIELDRHAISIFEVKVEHVFKRNQIARGHHLFAQANSLAVAVIDEELALTAKSTIRYIRPVKLGERVVAKARVEDVENDKGRTVVKVRSFVGEELVLQALLKCIDLVIIVRKVTTYENRNRCNGRRSCSKGCRTRSNESY